jgi:pimeloyl-ACP methyl ester carboxylesterase
VHDPLTYKGGFRNVTLEAVVRTWPEVATALVDGRPDVPVLLVHGEQDPVVPVSDARFVAAALPLAELAVFPATCTTC